MKQFRTLNPHKLTTEAMRAYVQAVNLGFNEDPVRNSRLVELTQDWTQKNNARLRGIWDDQAGMAESPVATFTSWDGTINVGAGLLEANFITNVTVRATHKRQGLLRKMMIADLTEAHRRGLPLATLTASDAEIYGRFGFGRATNQFKVNIDSGRKFQLRVEPTGHCEFMVPEKVLTERNQLFSQHHLTRRGSHSRPAYYDYLDFDDKKQEDDYALRALVHYDDDHNIDGLAYFRITDTGKRVLVEDMQYTNPIAEIALWQVLCGIELINTVTYGTFDPKSALPIALVDPRVMQSELMPDHFWLRILNITTALEARGFEADGQAILRVEDKLDFCSGTYQITVKNGQAKVSSTTAEPDLTLDIRELGSIYLGLIDIRTLAELGIVNGPGAQNVHDLFQVADMPWCNTSF